ncbi:hypothetical protein [Chitinophaga nivalis]|uniref:Uncharacterized protein n=1 Tax=Chitinophaga nivalis TaxID=2991709 RepID=A0ABT3IWD1_9BACT|nr:hypothetical protein [Chitinophaga nivalis]MCW3462025.1 hypothetical protein [Chitinophaga nivalis]MCW3488283.1 hypothetical protein [Chitinophaga nivalis]
MKPTKGLYLSVPTPCEENWDEMTCTATGRHCNNCSKTVIDFSRMSDVEMLAVIRNSGEEVCGYFNTTQLERVVAAPVLPRSSFIPTMLLSAGLMVSIANQGHAAARTWEKVEMDMTVPLTDTITVPDTRNGNMPPAEAIIYKGNTSWKGKVVCTEVNMVDPAVKIAPAHFSGKLLLEKKKKRWFHF